MRPAGKTTRLLWVTYDFPPRQAAGAFRPVKLYKYLDKSRLSIDFLTSRAESFASGEQLLEDLDPAPTVWRAGGLPLDRLFEKPKRVLARLGLARAEGRSLWERIAYRVVLACAFPDKHAWWGLRAAVRAVMLHARRRFDAVYTTSHPESAHLPGLLLKRLGVPWIVDYRYGGPLWTTTLTVGRRSVWGAAREIAYQRRVLERADFVIVQSDTIRNDFIARFGLAPERIVALPNGYDEEGFREYGTQQAPFARAPGELHLLHVGGDWYPDAGHVANLLDLCRRLAADIGADVVIHAVGVDILRDDLPPPGSGCRYVHHGHRPHREVIGYLAACDAFILSTMADTDSGRSITGFLPAKLWEYLRAGKAILWMGPQDDAWRYAEECGAVIYLGSLGSPRVLPATEVRAAIAAGARNQQRAHEHDWRSRAAAFDDIVARVLF
ncbi:MAG: glycosyltransferase [Proteobacteria bacterium]|nr:glycosyltransferase [Pseudomonadota bacterium]